MILSTQATHSQFCASSTGDAGQDEPPVVLVNTHWRRRHWLLVPLPCLRGPLSLWRLSDAGTWAAATSPRLFQVAKGRIHSLTYRLLALTRIHKNNWKARCTRKMAIRDKIIFSQCLCIINFLMKGWNYCQVKQFITQINISLKDCEILEEQEVGHSSKKSQVSLLQGNI